MTHLSCGFLFYCNAWKLMDGVDLSRACLRAPHSFGPLEHPAAGGRGNSRPMMRGPIQVLASDEAPREMKKYSFPVIVIVIVFSFVQISSAIVQFKTKSFSFSVIDAPAPFAVPVNRSGICGALYVANPPDACSSIRNLPAFGNADHVRFALIVRGNCTFEEKVRNTQAAGFRAAIVYDDQDNHNLMSMIGKPQGIQVHAVFVSRSAGKILNMYAQGKDGECCISPLLEGTAWTVLVISMFSLVIIVSVLAILILSRNNRLQRQRTDHYSPTINAEIVRNLPCVTFHTAWQNGNLMTESCAICLEVYRDGETLRVLPCQHAFPKSQLNLSAFLLRQIRIAKERPATQRDCRRLISQILQQVGFSVASSTEMLDCLQSKKRRKLPSTAEMERLKAAARRIALSTPVRYSTAGPFAGGSTTESATTEVASEVPPLSVQARVEADATTLPMECQVAASILAASSIKLPLLKHALEGGS